MENKTPTLEEVKAKFLNAKEVIGTCDINGTIEINTIYKGMTGCICCDSNKGALILYDSNNNKYAEIISYKEENETPKNFIYTPFNKQIETPTHYDNSKGSIYQFCENQNLNSYEFDIIKRVVRSRKKGNFKEDLEKTKVLIDLYLKEYEVR